MEHPFAGLKYRIFEHPRFLLHGLTGAATEVTVATLAWNLKRAMRVPGVGQLQRQLAMASFPAIGAGEDRCGQCAFQCHRHW